MSNLLLTTTKEQNAAVVAKYDGENPFSCHELMDDVNVSDLQKWVDGDEMGGLVDEATGGIIGYVNLAHLDRIVGLLNAAAVNAKAEEAK